MATIWIGVMLFALHSLLLVSSYPTRNSADPDQQSSACVSFKFNDLSGQVPQLFNMTYSPNPLSPMYLPTVESALSEAGLIFPSAIASNCSAHIGEFLLYAFFPQCSNFETTTILVFPCKAFCQRIRACCESGLASLRMPWPEWLNCDKIEAAVSNNQNACFSPPALDDDQNCSPATQPSGATATTTVPAATSPSAAAASPTPISNGPPMTSTVATNPLDAHGCSYFTFNPWSERYYNLTYAPNPLFPTYLPTVDSAVSEARRIFSSALATNCSKYIGEFLLSAYLPQCYFSPPSTHIVVLPCEDFCLAVRSCCSSALASYGIPWPQWLDCGNIRTAISARYPIVCFRPPSVETDSSCVATTTQAIASPTTMPPATTSSPIPPPPCYCNSTCDTCVIRASITEATFTVQNFDYGFAAKVTITSKRVGTCNTTYGITIIESYLPCPNSAVPQFPSSNAEITTYTQPCSSCIDLTIGQTYWVGGIYYVNCRGQPVWEIPRVKGAAALWVSKYDQKGPTWVQTARREHGC